MGFICNEFLFFSISIFRPLLESASSCLTVEMKGIEYMNDDPAEVDVLYGKINSDSKNDLVQKIADTILEYFTQKKLIRSDKFEHVKLHVTLMNSLFRDEDPEELSVEAPNFNRSKGNQKIRKTFNAINILKVSIGLDNLLNTILFKKFLGKGEIVIENSRILKLKIESFTLM